MLETIRKGRKYITGGVSQPSPVESVPVDPADPSYNRQHAELVRQYIEEQPESTTPDILAVKKIVAWLKERGLKGKERSMYSYTYKILKDEHAAGNLEFEKGVGYWKKTKLNALKPKREGAMIGQRHAAR
jgi:hypothetical protein